MKRIIFTLITAMLVACGTTESDEQKESQNESENMTISSQSVGAQVEDSIKEVEPIEENEQNDNDKEVVEITTERTVDLTGNYPWQYFFSEKIEELQNEGEIVFLFSDAEALEESILISIDGGFDASGFADHIELFLNDVSDIVEDHNGYFNKMQEVKEKLEQQNYEPVVDLIEEAKQLRESE